MMKKLLLTTGRGLSSWSNYKQSSTRWSFSRPPKWVSIDINKSIDGRSNIQRREWSYAAPAPSDKPNTLKSRKKVSRKERRAMVESYVKKYREINAGKFPTVTDTKKLVGGSYYVIREIVQELEYESKMSSSNIMNESLAEKELFNKSQPLTETVTVSSGKTETTIDGPAQNDMQLVDLDDKENFSVDYEDKRGPHSPRSLSDEDVTTTVSGSHFIRAEGNHIVRDAEEPSLSSLEMLSDAKTAEAESSCSDSVATRSHPLTQETKQVSVPFSEKSGSNIHEVHRHDPEFVHKETDTEEPSQSGFQISNKVKARSDLLAEESEHIPAPLSDKAGGGHGKAQSHNYEFVDVENHPVSDRKFIEKAEYERREHAALEGLPGMDNPKHKVKHSPGSSILDENKSDNTANEARDLAVTEKSTFWGNLKSFADGVVNFWRKL